ncbi:MAG TPA: YidB family protein [Gaiellaceae bacterium]|nr:YidB family protein [Gaiellaceae bacterium]
MGGLGDLLKGAGGGSGGGLGDLLGGILGGASQGGGSSGSTGLGGNPMLRMLLPLVASLLMNGGLQKVLGRLQQSGKGATGRSWVTTGPNEPVDAADIKAALDEGELAEIAQQLGVSEDEAADAVAQVLPDVVDQATPSGELPDDEELDRTFGRLHELDGVREG